MKKMSFINIAKELNVSPATVRNIYNSAMKKLEVKAKHLEIYVDDN